MLQEKPSVRIIIVGIIGGIVGSLLTMGVMSRNTHFVPQIGSISQKISIQEDSAVVDAVKKVSPSVVSIATSAKGIGFWGDVVEQKGGGTGFIVTADGLILTNKHVVDGAQEFTVVTNEGKDYKGKVVAVDPLFDLALIKIEGKDLPVVEIGDSTKLDIGQKVIAIGNALGEYQNSVTVGVLSARARAITAASQNGSERLEGLLQTDAPINPGNSGGPLINAAGQVIGINTAVDAQGNSIGFAIPIHLAKAAVDSYTKSGRIVRSFLGVRYINITHEFAALNHLDVSNGALIMPSQGNLLSIVPGGPADKAGLKENDIITAVNGEKIEQSKSLVTILSAYTPGTKVEVTYMRKGKEEKVTVELTELKDTK
ncbi:MAG: trypsin-like peptidase domain-containing protein [Patescibacteria group bacterium]